MAALPPTALDMLVYYRRTDNIELVPLASPTTDVGASSSTTATGISIGFTFTFDGVDYTSCALSPRGFLRLAGTVTSSSNANLFGSNTSQVLAPWWDATETADSVGYIKHEVQGTAPFRRFIAEWYVNLSDAYTATNALRAKFQCILFETKGKAEFRYGTVETVGSPANLGSASIGVKGDTSSTTDNYRDLAVNNRALGGSKTTSTTSLRGYNANEWPGGQYRIVMEPNWPMTGRYFDIDQASISGMQDPECEYWWRVANNVNTLYCTHNPALVNLSPWGAAIVLGGSYVQPVTPSADGLSYDVTVIAYTPSLDADMGLDRDDADDPQPSDDADWASLDNVSASPASDDFTTYETTVVLDADVTWLRQKLGATAVKTTSILVRPAVITAFDPYVSLPSGFVWMGIGQVMQTGAAIHPEWLNRAWKNCAYVLADRKQMIWSFGTCDDADTDFEFVSTTFEVQTIGWSGCEILGWPNSTVDVQIVAKDTVGDNDAPLIVNERGGSSVSFEVNNNSDEYRLQSAELVLTSDEPTIVATCDPVGPMRVAFVGVTWAPSLSDTDYILGVTPVPRLSYLGALAARLRKACLDSYGMTGLATNLFLNGVGDDYYRVAWMIPPGVHALRPKLQRHDGASKNTDGSQPTTMFGASSGISADDEILIPNPHTTGRDTYPPNGGSVKSQLGAYVYNDSPTDPMDRMLESPTSGLYGAAVYEMVRVWRGVGITLIPIQPPQSG